MLRLCFSSISRDFEVFLVCMELADAVAMVCTKTLVQQRSDAFLATPFRTGIFRSNFLATFPGEGLGASLDGHQDRSTSRSRSTLDAATYGSQATIGH